MFKVAKREVRDVEPFEYYPSDAELTLGSAANLGSGGKLSKAASTVKPSHIVMGEKNADGMYPAMKVVPTSNEHRNGCGHADWKQGDAGRRCCQCDSHHDKRHFCCGLDRWRRDKQHGARPFCIKRRKRKYGRYHFF